MVGTILIFVYSFYMLQVNLYFFEGGGEENNVLKQLFTYFLQI